MTVTYRPSPSDRAREQVAIYEATDGREGASLDGRPVVILTTTGARTGSIRKNPVMRIKLGDNYIAVASNGGDTVDPAWHRNLEANPEVSLQDGATVYRLRAREVRGEEKTFCWQAADRAWPGFAEFRARAVDRQIPVMMLEHIPLTFNI